MAKTYSTVPDKAAGDVFTESMWDDYLRTNLNNLIVPAAVRAHRTTTQSIPHSTFTDLLFDSERFDTDGMHSTVTNTNRLTVTTPGLYLIGGHVYWAFNGTGLRSLRIMLNGSTALGYTEHVTSSLSGPGQQISTLYNLAANDYVTLNVWQNSGSAVNIETGAAYSAEFWAVWVGRTS